MSVISEKSHRRMYLPHNNHYEHRNGFNSSRSDIEVNQRSYLLPRFSAAASESTKIDLGDDNWAENTTVVTGATSEHSYSGLPDRFDFDNSKNGSSNSGSNSKNPLSRRCSRLCWFICAFIVSTASLISAPLMIIMPLALGNLPLYLATIINSNNVGSEITVEYEWPPMQCDVFCQGDILNLMIQTALLILFLHIVYWRRISVDLPRLHVRRAIFILFTLFFLFAFWLFYIVRIIFERNANFPDIVKYSMKLLTGLIFIHALWIIYDYFGESKPIYIITIVRDPDGESQSFQIGQMSIQEAAVYALKLYHSHFSTYNPYLDNMRQSAILTGAGGTGYRNNGGGRYGGSNGGYTGGPTAFKLYDIEGRGGTDSVMTTLPEANARILVEASLRRRMAGHNNDVLYAEAEYEKRLNKRRCRLIGCAEECFTHFQVVSASNANSRVEQMDPSTAAKAVFSSLARPLNRYLRFTRQQPYHNQKQISSHLEKCLAYQFSARTFLQRFFSNRKPYPEEMTAKNVCEMESKWSILCDVPASGSLFNGIDFVLRSHSIATNLDAGVQLHCSFTKFSFYNITEQRLPDKSKFELRIINS